MIADTILFLACVAPTTLGLKIFLSIRNLKYPHTLPIYKQWMLSYWLPFMVEHYLLQINK